LTLGTKPRCRKHRSEGQAVCAVPSITTAERNVIEMAQKNAMRIIESYMSAHDLEILKWDHPINGKDKVDVIFRDKENLVFAMIKVSETLADDNKFPDDRSIIRNRALLESGAIKFLAQNPVPSCVVRFDVIAIMLMNHGAQALIRHHRDALCTNDI
jgi:Holliday junction resolvase-like predicted endonuclease